MKKTEIFENNVQNEKDKACEENKGRFYGTIGLCIIFLMIVIFNIMKGQNNFIPCSIFFAYTAAEAINNYYMEKTKGLILTATFAAISAIIFFACHVCGVLGICL